MKRITKKIFNTIKKENGQISEEINQEIPEYKEIEDSKEAKATRKSYLDGTIQKVEENIEIENAQKQGNFRKCKRNSKRPQIP